MKFSAKVKIFIITFFTVSILLCLSSGHADYEGITAQGQISNTVSWQLIYDSAHTGLVLTISGAGSMPDWTVYEEDGALPPWNEYKEEITSISIGSGVTTIGCCAFYGCVALQHISFPNSLTSIGDNAFSGCSLLEELDFPVALTQIGSEALSDCNSLTELIIPQNVNKLGVFSIAGCQKLKTIVIPNSITNLEMGVFSGCSSLETITLPSSLTSIGDNTFACCYALKTLFIPASVEYIHPAAFPACRGLTEINVAANNPNYCSEYGVLFTKNKTSLLLYPCERPGNEYTVPSTVTEIASGAFGDNTILQTVHLPDTLITIGDYAFGDSWITSINIPRNLQYLGDSAFINCSNLHNCDLVIPGTIKTIGSGAFICAAFHTLVIEEGLTRIDDAFSNLNYASEATITLPVSLKYIAPDAFFNTVTIRCHHDTVADTWAKRNGNPIIYVCDEKTQINPATLEEDGFIKTACSICNYSVGPVVIIQHTKVISIPTSTRIIGEDAFSNVAAEQVCIPASVERIEPAAFTPCTNLKLVVFDGMSTNIDNAAFDDSSGIVFYCIKGSDAETYAIEHSIPRVTK